MTFLGAMFSQPLPWPGKLRLAGEEAELRAQAAGGSVGRARLSVEARVRRAYYEYLAARERLGLVEERDHSWREIFDVARDRYAAGIGAQQDVLRAQVEVLRLDEARADENARVANGRRSSIACSAARRTTRSRRPSASSSGRKSRIFRPCSRRSARRSPELAALGCGIEADHSRVLLTKKQFLPDFVASGGPMYRGGSRSRCGRSASESPFPSTSVPGSSLVWPRPRRSSGRNRSARPRRRSSWSSRLASAFRISTRRFASLACTGTRSCRRTSFRWSPPSPPIAPAKVPFVTVLEALNTLYADRALFIARLADAEKWRVSIDEGDLQPTGAMAGAAPPGTESGTSTMTRAAAAMATSAGMR